MSNQIPRDRQTNEIEITPEMREAGAGALEAFSESYDQETLAEAVYTAMRKASLVSTARHAA